MANRETRFPIPKNEQYYYDEVTNTLKPVVKDEGMLPVQSIQKKWKDDFSKTTLNEEKWEVVKTGAGQTIDPSIAGDCRINTGTTPDAETIILSKEFFTIPMRGLFGFQISQKIANQEFYLEFVSVDKATGVPDGKSKVAWKISGTDSTTTSNARTMTQAGGMTPVESGNLSVSVAQTTSALYELELFSDEIWYHTRTMDSTAGRAYSSVRHNNIPDPNAYYKVQIRVKNGSTAPASNTMLQLFFVNVVDYAELTAEITAGRGGASAGQSIATNVTGGSLSTVTSAYVAPKIAYNTEFSASINAGTTSTGSNRTTGTTPIYTIFRIRAFSANAMRIDVRSGTSTTVTSNRIQQVIDVPANTVVIVDVPICAPNIGLQCTNLGASAVTPEVLSVLMS